MFVKAAEKGRRNGTAEYEFPDEPEKFLFQAAPFLRPLSVLRTDDPWLSGGLRRGAVYSRNVCLDMGDKSPVISDHLSFGRDMPRDSFFAMASLLPIWPDLARNHLRFYYQNALAGSLLEYTYMPDISGQEGAAPDEYSLDAAGYLLLELYRYWRLTGDENLPKEPEFKQGIDKILKQVVQHQSPKLGLVSSTHRASDEECVFPYYIPANMLLVMSLEKISMVLRELYGDDSGATEAQQLASDIREAIFSHGVVKDEQFGRMFAFEVSESGEYLLYDQADIPNLTSMPFFGFCSRGEEVFDNTLRFVYSERNIGYRRTASGKFRALTDGSKRFPDSPWPLGKMSEMMSAPRDPKILAEGFQWLSLCLPPSLQLPETIERHTGRTCERYWFAWPSALMLMLFNECVCGIRIGEKVVIDPVVPDGWKSFWSPLYSIGGRQVQVVHEAGTTSVLIDGERLPVPVEI